MSSPAARPPSRRPARQPEPEEPYPTVPEPRQSHAGNVLAILSVMAVLAFGLWTAFSTLTTPDKPPTKASPTSAPTTQAAAKATPAPTSAPTAVAAGPTSAPTSPTATASTGSRVHVVGAGDTLYGIARRYGTTVEAIMAANGFNDRSKILHVGDRLIIP